MEAASLLRPAARGCLAAASRTAAPIQRRAGPIHMFVARRHKSTANRTKRALSVPPHPSFLARGSAAAAPAQQPQQDHIVFNPPSSAPSVFHTPFKFLPRSDPRRRANLTALFAQSATIQFAAATASASASSSSSSSSSSSAAASAAAILPSAAPRPQSPATSKRNHLSQEDVAEMRRLREADPDAWHVLALARRFDCAPMFVMMACQAPREKLQREQERVDRAKARWGDRRARAREDRQRRREMLLRGEI